MCVIILRNPKVDIPFEKLKAACIVNPDGWGIAVADRGKLKIFHGLAGKDEETDPETIAKILEDAKEQPVLLHLRYVTAGERSLVNCHPFTALTKDKDGADVVFAHNGTLWTYKQKDSTYSDSYHFNQKLVQPLLKRVIKFTGPDNLLKDEFVAEILEEKAGSNSLFGLIDGNGAMLAINYASGKQHEGWWSSNEYSFNTNHRGTDTDYATDYEKFWKSQDDSRSWERVNTCGLPYGTTQTSTSAISARMRVAELAAQGLNVANQDDLPWEDQDEEEAQEIEDLLKQGEKIHEVVASMTHHPRLNPKLVGKLLGADHLSFTKICKIDNLNEMTRFDPEDIAELVSFYPEAATVLIQDLLAELYIKNRTATVKAAVEAQKQAQEAA